MVVEPLVPDRPDAVAPGPAPTGAFTRVVDAASDALARADAAEQAFVAHRGGLQEMVVERARADIALQIATSGTQRTVQALQTIFGMQV